ncbi:MAG: tRNA (adenosine(37)-N6)-dimethylallyltransferase MiaA [Verrucomicrobiota bacterium]
MNRADPVFLAGPTAVGKSEVALVLAEKLEAEIISVDSMQVYRGLDIGTAKPTVEERRRIPHHLIDVVELTEHFDAAQFVERARAAVLEIARRGRRAIFCGGTGLYFKAWLEGLGSAPPSNAPLRSELEQLPMANLLEELAAKDPEFFRTVDQRNKRRVVRALEVIRLTSRTFSEQRAAWTAQASPPASVSAGPIVLGLQRSPEDLRGRIEQRVDAMFAQGLIEETRRLLEHGLEHNRTAMQAIGYRQVIEYLRGERSHEETIALVKTRTRQFAKRQRTWFRHQLPMQWVEVAAQSTAREIAGRLETLLTDRA